MTEYRSPIVAVLGHIDHGKTSLLDKIRNSRVAEGEAGGITQSIGSTFMPMDVINGLCKKMFDKFGIIPSLSGLLFIDTPGHEAFIAMRERGSHIADLAVLIVDINEGFMPQTVESLQILLKSKTPFVVALNKIDKIYSWKNESDIFLENFVKQSPGVQESFEKRFYEILSELDRHGLKADRFDRISDFSKEIATVPISAKSGEGISELLFVLTGLSEKYLKPSLEKGNKCKGVVLEVKEMKGLGTTIDAIIYDGRINKGDYIVISGTDPACTKIKGLMVPGELKDIRAERKFEYIDYADASCGIKIFASNLENAVPGSEFVTVKTELEADSAKKEMIISYDVQNSEEEGLIFKADTLGGLEALKNIFKDYNVKYAEVGPVSRNDIISAGINKDPFLKAIICFNMNINEETESFAKSSGIKIFSSPVIYHLIENYRKWKDQKQQEIEMEKMKGITFPAKFQVLPGCVFRASKPAVVGCEILSGTIKPDYKVFRVDDKEGIVNLGSIKQIQSEGVVITEAKSGEKVAISITEGNYGKNFSENDLIYTDINQNDFNIFKQFLKILSADQKQALEEIGRIKNLW